jgi:hypothetical protein
LQLNVTMSEKFNGENGQEQAPQSQGGAQNTTLAASLKPPGLGSSSELDIPAGTFGDRATAEDEAARKERKRLKKEKKKKSKDPEAKRKKKEKKAKREKRRHDKARISGESASSADKDLIAEQQQHHHHSSSTSRPHAETKSAWRGESGTTANTDPVSLTPGSSSSPVVERRQSLAEIIKEQEEEQRAEEMKRGESMDSKELEALGGGKRLPGETDEERMVRLAIEMSLNERKQQSSSYRSAHSESSARRSNRAQTRSTSVPAQRLPPAELDESANDDISLREGEGLVRSNSHHSLQSSTTLGASVATMDVTEVVIEDPRGNMKSQRRMSTKSMLPPQYARNTSDSKRAPSRASLKDYDDDPKAALYDDDDDPKAQFDTEDDPLAHWDDDDAKKKFIDAQIDPKQFSEVPRRPAYRTNRSSNGETRDRRSSTGSQTRPLAAIRPVDQIRLARQNLSAQEAEEIERALREAGEDADDSIPSSTRQSSASRRRQSEPPISSPPTQQRPRIQDQELSPSARDVVASDHLSPNEAAEIAKALQEADEAEARESFQLALQLQSQEATLFTAQRAMRARAGQPRKCACGTSRAGGAHQ